MLVYVGAEVVVFSLSNRVAIVLVICPFGPLHVVLTVTEIFTHMLRSRYTVMSVLDPTGLIGLTGLLAMCIEITAQESSEHQ